MRRVIALVAVAGLLLVLPMQAVAAKEGGSSSAEVSYVVDENSHYPLVVKTGVGGTVFDGEQKIRDSTMTYELKIGTQKQFRIVPDQGWEVATITYDRPALSISKSLLSQYLDTGMITVRAETTDMHLNIVFKKRETIQHTNMVGTSQHPNTGINMHIAEFYFMLIASAIGIVLYKRQQRRSKE